MDILLNDLVIIYGVTSQSIQGKEILESTAKRDHVKSLRQL